MVYRYMDYSNTSTMKVNNTQVRWPAKDICTCIRTAHQFQPNSFIRDQGVDEFWKEICKTDIVLSNSEKVALSKEDHMFMNSMKDNIGEENGHYVLPLPFRDEKFKMPCNRQVAERRAQSVKTKMLKNQSFREDYYTSLERFFMCLISRENLILIWCFVQKIYAVKSL